MNSGLVLEFTKMHGAGNDFIVVDNRFFRFSDAELSAIAARYCPRRVGVGADGLLALNVADSADVDYRMRYFNADGSLSRMCGNGARCLAAFAREGGISSDPLRFVTDAGIFRAHVENGSTVTVRLIVPGPDEVIPHFTSVAVDSELRLTLAFTVVGVPHAICFGKDVDVIPVQTWGWKIRHDSSFDASAGTNVDFAEILNSREEPIIKVRTYERGVEAETLACGTGALSTLAAAVASGKINGREAVVRMPGGDLRVGFIDNSDDMFLQGPVTFAYRGNAVL